MADNTNKENEPMDARYYARQTALGYAHDPQATPQQVVARAAIYAAFIIGNDG
jgi:hypothetical protein